MEIYNPQSRELQPEEEATLLGIMESFQEGFTSLVQSSVCLIKNKCSTVDPAEINKLRCDLGSLTQSIQARLQGNPNLQAVEANEITLQDILREIQAMHLNLQSLSESTSVVQRKIENLLKDASGESKVEFANIKAKEGKWTIEAKCGEGATGCFRNVDIYEIETGRRVATFLLIEPFVTIKTVLDTELIPMNHLVAKIGNKIVSNPFFIPKAKILSVNSEEGGFIITIENLSSETVENFRIIDGNIIEIAVFEGLASGIKTPLMFSANFTGSVKLYVEENGVLISNAYEFDIAPEDFETMVMGLDSEIKQQIARAIKGQYGHLSGDDIIVASNYGRDNYENALRYLQSIGKI